MQVISNNFPFHFSFHLVSISYTEFAIKYEKKIKIKSRKEEHRSLAFIATDSLPSGDIPSSFSTIPPIVSFSPPHPPERVSITESIDKWTIDASVTDRRDNFGSRAAVINSWPRFGNIWPYNIPTNLAGHRSSLYDFPGSPDHSAPSTMARYTSRGEN